MSPILSAAAGSLLAHLGRATLSGALFIALVALLVRAAPRLPAGLRCALWWLACLKLLVGLVWLAPLRLPLLPAAWAAPVEASVASGGKRGHGVPPLQMPNGERSGAPYLRSSSTVSSPVDPYPVGAAPRGRPLDVGNNPLPAPLQRSGSSWRLGLLVLWLTGVSLELALLGWSLWRSRRLIRRAAPVREPLLLGLFARLAQRLGLHREPGLRLSSEVQTPQALGGLRPQVLLPQRRISALSPAEIEMTLCHELLHVRRGDLWLAWVPALAQRIFFFFPPAAWAAREYLVAREAACDAEVVRVLGSAPQAYGRLLLRWGVAPRETGLAAAGASPSLMNLKRRLQMLHETSETTRRSRLRWGLVGAAALVALLPFTIVAQQRTPEPPESPEPPSAAEPALAPEPGEPMPAPEPGDAVEAVEPGEPMPAPEPGDAVEAAEPEEAVEAAEPGEAVPALAAEAPEPAEMPAPRPSAPLPPPMSRAPRAGSPAPVLAPRALRAPQAVPGPMPVAMAIEAPAPRAPRTPLPPGAAPVAIAPRAARAPRTPLPPGVAPVAIAPRVAGAPYTPPPGAPPVAIAPPAPRSLRTPLPPGAAPVAVAAPVAGALWSPRSPGAVPAPRAVAAPRAVPPAPATWTPRSPAPPVPPPTWTPRPGATPHAQLPGRAEMVVARTSPPAPPTPPAAPRPPTPAKGHSTSWYSHDGDQPWVYLSGNDTSMSGSRSDVEEAKRLRGSGGDLFWFKRAGKAYLVRDAATLARIEALWKPVGELGAQQGKLGGEQGRLGGQQGALGAKQGALGARMGALAAQQAGSGERGAARYEKESAALGREMEELGRQQEELGRQQEVLGRQQEALGRKQEEASRRAESELAKLIDETLRNGLAQPVK